MDEMLTAASSLGDFAIFALVLAMIGLYGATSYSVTQRTQEIGVRVALDASRLHVLKLALGRGAAVSCAGIVIGIGCSLLVTRVLENLVYTISTRDPLTYAVVPAIFLICALVASYVPARRAMRVDVLDALRQ